MKKAAVPLILVAAVLLAFGVTAEAQQPTKVPRIGYSSRALRVLLFGPSRSISPMAARARVCRRKKHRH